MSCRCGAKGCIQEQLDKIVDALDCLKADIVNLQAEVRRWKLGEPRLGPGNPYKEKENMRIELNRIIDKLNT